MRTNWITFDTADSHQVRRYSDAYHTDRFVRASVERPGNGRQIITVKIVAMSTNGKRWRIAAVE